MHEFKHPKYYKELRKRNKSDQAISQEAATAAVGVRPGPGLKLQASGSKRQVKPEPSSGSQASSDKRQAPGSKLQASSHKLQAQ